MKRSSTLFFQKKINNWREHSSSLRVMELVKHSLLLLQSVLSLELSRITMMRVSMNFRLALQLLPLRNLAS